MHTPAVQLIAKYNLQPASRADMITYKPSADDGTCNSYTQKQQRYIHQDIVLDHGRYSSYLIVEKNLLTG